MDRERYGERRQMTPAEIEIYDCGYTEGFADAMRRVEAEKYGERSYRINDQYTGKDPGAYGERGSYDMRDIMAERRGRDAMGRFR